MNLWVKIMVLVDVLAICCVRVIYIGRIAEDAADHYLMACRPKIQRSVSDIQLLDLVMQHQRLVLVVLSETIFTSQRILWV